MTLRVVGAGFPRTGTSSLKLALERLLDAPCHHMHDFFHRAENGPAWRDAAAGDPAAALSLLGGYAATVDTPACLLWRELADAHPDAVVLLSRRDDAAQWWASADATVLGASRRVSAATARGERPAFLQGEPADRAATVVEVFAWMTRDLYRSESDAAVAMAAYDAWNDAVRAAVPAERLVEWRPGDGWDPLCSALGLPVPDEPFPHANTRAEFIARNSR